MPLAILVVGFVMTVALWRIAAELGSINRGKQTRELPEREATGLPDEEMELSRTVGELTKLHKSLGAIRVSVDAVSRELSSISRALDRLAPERSPKVEKEPSRIENERREEIRAVTKNLRPKEFAAFIAHRYRLPADHPWLLSMLTPRDAVGLDAVIERLVVVERPNQGTHPPAQKRASGDAQVVRLRHRETAMLGGSLAVMRELS
jgi:hypothetical protein